MKGEYQFRVKSKKVVFDFVIRRNITIIKGDSATGKTTLLYMLYEYLRVGRESGYSVSTNADFFVYMRREIDRDWQDVLYPLKNRVIFIEENNSFVFEEEFARFVKESGNYFVLVNRSPLKMLPYSIHEIYEIVTEGRHADVRESYHEFKELYSNFPFIKDNYFQTVLTEDSSSGKALFAKIYSRSIVESAGGNGNIVNKLQDLKGYDVLVIADGAAFGALIENCLEYIDSKDGQRISVWLPESFEYLLLKSGVINSKELPEILQNISSHVESEKYVSWERFFTELAETISVQIGHPYTKDYLDGYYLTDRNVRKVVEQFPEDIRPD